jgi:hypothetical protein
MQMKKCILLAILFPVLFLLTEPSDAIGGELSKAPAINLWVDLGLGLITEEEAKEKMKLLGADFKSTLKAETKALRRDIYGVRIVSGKQFETIIAKINTVSSFSKTTVIGKTQEVGYLEVKFALSSSHGYVAIVCTPLNELPESIKKNL